LIFQIGAGLRPFLRRGAARIAAKELAEKIAEAGSARGAATTTAAEIESAKIKMDVVRSFRRNSPDVWSSFNTCPKDLPGCSRGG